VSLEEETNKLGRRKQERRRMPGKLGRLLGGVCWIAGCFGEAAGVVRGGTRNVGKRRVCSVLVRRHVGRIKVCLWVVGEQCGTSNKSREVVAGHFGRGKMCFGRCSRQDGRTTICLGRCSGQVGRTKQ
jgi:hypothetical protein